MATAHARRTAIAAAAALLLGAGTFAAGCGGDSGTAAAPSTSTRGAAATGSCDPSSQRRSQARSLAVRNLLPVSVTVTMSNVNCAQWSGVSTPYAWNGTVIAPGSTETRRMEIAKGAVPAWTMALVGAKSDTPFRIRCTNPDNACGYDVLGAPAGPWPDSVVMGTTAEPSWAATPEQQASLERMPVNQVVVWSDGTKVYVFAHTGDPREITDSVT